MEPTPRQDDGLARAHPGRDAHDGVVTADDQALVLKNAYGEVHTLSPWRLVDYWTWTREPDPDDFVIR